MQDEEGPTVLPQECTNDPVSPGAVQNSEHVGRGAFAKDRKKLTEQQISSLREPDTRFKMGLVALKQLRERECSVYRDLADRPTNRAEVIEKIKASKPDDDLLEILWANTGVIRGYLGPKDTPDVRLFLVIDSVICDRAGNKHRLHVNIGYTDEYARLLDPENEKDDPPALYAREQLLVLLSRNPDPVLPP